jgi:spore maturation protein CgeB
MSRPLRILLAHPGATWSVSDVFDGLDYGLRQHGVEVEHYRLDTRIEASRKALHALWRMKKKTQPDLQKPNQADLIYHASVGILEMALRLHVDVVLVVSAMFLHPDVVVMMRRAGLKVTVLFTESPYDHDKEIAMAAMVDGCWTNERACVPAFRAVNPNSGYLPHAWHPLKHFPDRGEDVDVAAHDVVFVGSGFPERIAWFNSIDWSGIDLGLYGTWKGLGLNKQVSKCVKGAQVNNQLASALYRRAKIGLNLYRTRTSSRHTLTVTPESLSPRAYELAACRSFHLSDPRAEVREVFGDCVPTFSTPREAAALIRLWLANEPERVAMAAQLPACVAEASWVERAKTVLGDLSRLLSQQAAA